MKIVSAKFWSEDLELTRPYSIAYETIDAVENIFVYLALDNGKWGIGSGSPAAFITGENIAMSRGVLQNNLEALVINKDIASYKDICKSMSRKLKTTPAARAAIDIALHDAWSRFNEKPLVEILGRSHQSFLTSITIGIKSLQETLSEAIEYVDRGFRILKVKTGASVTEDIELIRKLREAVGKNILVRVDANQGYTSENLIQFAKGTASENVEFIEQPLPNDKDSDMMQVSEEIRIQCAADESLHHPDDAENLAAEPHLFGIYNIKLMKSGGIYPALEIANTAHRSGINLMWGCMDESRISISAALHAALACPATTYLDLDGSLDLARDLVTGGFVLTDGYLSVSDAHGLGVKLIEKVIV